VKFLMLVAIGLLSALLTFAMNWLALIPWRKAKGQHWSERARVYHPAKVAAASNLWILPAVTSMSVFLLFPENGPHWALVAIASSIGTLLGTVSMDHEVFPRIEMGSLLVDVARSWVIRFFMWFVFLGAIVLMPRDFNWLTIIIPLAVVAILMWWSRKGWTQAGRWLRLVTTPPQRLSTIVQNAAAKMNVPVKELLFLRSKSAQAYAIPAARTLIFTERLVDLMTDDEISAVCAHELAHLTEARSDWYKRYIAWLIFLPWVFLKPMIYTFGLQGFFGLLLIVIMAPRISRRISHKLEIRADTIAHANEPDPGVYARALAKLYEDNLLPAVNAKNRATHPHLYDRLLAAGVTPDFPRPPRTTSISWNGAILAFALGGLAMMVVSRLTDVPLFR
jgi:Zn-dependent protease with chaperone function